MMIKVANDYIIHWLPSCMIKLPHSSKYVISSTTADSKSWLDSQAISLFVDVCCEIVETALTGATTTTSTSTAALVVRGQTFVCDNWPSIVR